MPSRADTQAATQGWCRVNHPIAAPRRGDWRDRLAVVCRRGGALRRGGAGIPSACLQTTRQRRRPMSFKETLRRVFRPAPTPRAGHDPAPVGADERARAAERLKSAESGALCPPRAAHDGRGWDTYWTNHLRVGPMDQAFADMMSSDESLIPLLVDRGVRRFSAPATACRWRRCRSTKQRGMQRRPNAELFLRSLH
jgi:hypothetical protein